MMRWNIHIFILKQKENKKKKYKKQFIEIKNYLKIKLQKINKNKIN